LLSHLHIILKYIHDARVHKGLQAIYGSRSKNHNHSDITRTFVCLSDVVRYFIGWHFPYRE